MISTPVLIILHSGSATTAAAFVKDKPRSGGASSSVPHFAQPSPPLPPLLSILPRSNLHSTRSDLYSSRSSLFSATALAVFILPPWSSPRSLWLSLSSPPPPPPNLVSPSPLLSPVPPPPPFHIFRRKKNPLPKRASLLPSSSRVSGLTPAGGRGAVPGQ